MVQSHTLSLLVDNRFGVLTRITGLISRRGFNIESLAVGTTEDQTLSRVTVVVSADDVALEQIKKQLHKLVNVHKINDFTKEPSVDRELVLFKVSAPAETRHEIIELVNVFRAKIIDVGRTTMTIEATGTADKLAAMEDLFRSYGIKEMARTGKIALSRGN
ncbi:MAG: acetolactate synthase small subunit [Coriobacteriales bacterium]|jgi:acetolactate synthase-1/3 small subunit